MIKGTLSALAGLRWFEVLVLTGILILIGWVTLRLKNPIQFVPASAWFRLSVLLVLVFLNLLIISWMSSNQLNTVSVVRHGIIDFELAKTDIRAKEIRTAWAVEENQVEFPDGSGRIVALVEIARRDIFIDFLFIAGYVALISFSCFWIAEDIRWDVLSQAGTMIGWSVVAAGVLDVVENLAMLVMLEDGPTPFLAAVSFWSALPKFVLILGFAGAFILAGLAILSIQPFVRGQ